MATYEIWLDDAYGRRAKLVDKFTGFNATRVANGIGALSLQLSPDYDAYLKKDAVIEVWRKPTDGALAIFNAYFIRDWLFASQVNGDFTTVWGLDGGYLLDGRIVAYDAASAQCLKTDYADDLIKAVVRENLGSSATDTDRDLTSAGFSVEVDQSAAQSITLGFAYKNVLDVCKEAASASREAGTRLYYEVVPTIASTGKITWEFRTHVNQPGIDRTGTAKLVFGDQWGNLEGGSIEYDYTDERTVVYSCGQGIKSERIVEEVEDTTRSSESPWARREKAYNCSGQAETSAAVTAAGNARLNELRPALRTAGTITEGMTTKLGVHWGCGDKVVTAYRGKELDAIITAVTVSLDGEGRETIGGRFEVIV